MSAVWSIGPIPPRTAFKQLLRTESLLVLRQRLGLTYGVAVPLILLVIFGSVTGAHKAQGNLGGLTYLDIYLPIVVAMVLNNVALFSLPPVLASYREEGILRRLATTPVLPSWVLAVQLIINFCLAITAMIIIVVLGIAVFGLSVPQNLGGFVIAVLLCIASQFALGLWISSIARTGTAARSIAQFLFFPLMFLAGLWYPQALMPTTLRHISDYSPLGSFVQALETSVQGHFPPATPLLVMIGYTLVFGFLAVRSFKWE